MSAIDSQTEDEVSKDVASPMSAQDETPNMTNINPLSQIKEITECSEEVSVDLSEESDKRERER